MKWPGWTRVVCLLTSCVLSACGTARVGQSDESRVPGASNGEPEPPPVSSNVAPQPEIALAQSGFLANASGIRASSLPAPVLDARLRCGRVGALPLGDETPLLGGRLMIRGVQGASTEPRPWNVMGAPEPVESETRLYLEAGREKVVVMSYELFRLAGEDFVARVREDVERSFPGSSLERVAMIGNGLEALQVVPGQLDTSDEAVFTYGLYVVSPNRTVQVLSFYVNPEAATDREACIGLAMRSAQTLRAGSAALDFSAHAWRLTTGPPEQLVELTLPERFVAITQEGPDFFVHRINELSVFGQSSGVSGLLYFGGHPSRTEYTNQQEVEGPLLGENTTWYRWSNERFFAEALRPLSGHIIAHGFVSGVSDAAIEPIVQALGSASVVAP